MTTAAIKDQARAQANSTTTTTVDILIYTPPVSNVVMSVIATVIARDTSNNKSAAWKLAASFTNVAGSASQVQTNTTLDAKIEAGCLATLPPVQSTGASGGFKINSAQSGSANITWDVHADVVMYEYA